MKELYRLFFLMGWKVALVNIITCCRIVAAPVLFYFLLVPDPVTFKWLLLISFLTDALDGFLARRLHASTLLGARLDSIGDLLTLFAAVAGILITRSDFVTEQVIVISTILVLFLFQMVVALIRYHRLSSFHTYLAKGAAVLQGSFMLSLFFFPEVFYPLFYFASAVTVLELAEEIILVFLIPQWRINIKGLYWYMMKNVS